MRKTLQKICVFFLAFVALATNAFAQQAPVNQGEPDQLPAAYIAVVDYNYVIRESLAAKSVALKLEELRKQYRSDMQLQEQELKEAQEEWNELRTVLDKEALVERRKEFEVKFMTLQQTVQQKKRELDLGFEGAMLQVKRKVTESVAVVAEQVGANLVLSKKSVVIAGRELDITQYVLDDVNKKFPTVEVVLGEEK